MDPQPARDALDAFLAEIGRLNVDDLAMVALPEPDPHVRDVVLQRAVDAAAAADRRELLAEAPARAREAIVRAFSARSYDPTWFGLNWGRSLGRADDRARLIAAVEDAAVAAVTADLLPADDIATLREPYEIASSMRGSAPDANPPLGRRRGIVAALFVLGAVSTTAVGGGFSALAALIARRRR